MASITDHSSKDYPYFPTTNLKVNKETENISNKILKAPILHHGIIKDKENTKSKEKQGSKQLSKEKQGSKQKLKKIKFSSNRLLTHDNVNYQQGFGLWCNLQKEDKMNRDDDFKKMVIDNKLLNSAINSSSLNFISNNQNTNHFSQEIKDLDDQINKKVIKLIKQKNERLAYELEEALIKQNELEYFTNKEKDNTLKISLEMKLKIEENLKLQDKIKSQENLIHSLNDALNVAKKEIIKNKEEIEKLHDIIKLGKAKITELEIEFNKRKELYNEENKSLLSQLQKMSTMIDEENDNTNDRSNLRSRLSKGPKSNINNLSVKDVTEMETNDDKTKEDNNKSSNKLVTVSNNDINRNIQKYIPPPNKLESIEFKLQLEIVDLKDKIDKLEVVNRQQYSSLKRKKDEISSLKQINVKIIDYIQEVKADSKWKDSNLMSKKYEIELLKNKLQCKAVKEPVDKNTQDNDSST